MFSSPLGLLAFLAVPAIVALHYFRRRFRPHVVSALFLWTDDDRTPLSGRKRDRLRHSASLWSEIAAAVALALLLAGPRACAADAGRHLVVVLDGSASMSARTPAGDSLANRATDLVARRIDELARGSRVTLIQSANRPRVLAGPAAFPEEARQKLADFAPSALHHELTAALALALQLSGGGAVVCVTDRHRPDEFPPEVELCAIGLPLDNLAIVRASRSTSKTDGEKLHVTLASFADARRETHVAAYDRSGRAVLAQAPVTLAPGEQKSLSFALAPDAGAIEVRLDEDALALDDHAFLAPRPKRTVTIGAALAGDTARALGLASSADSPVGRWLALVDDVAPARDAESAHLLVADREAGGPATWTLRLVDQGRERKDFIGPFLAERRHPLLEGTTLEGIVWSVAPDVVLAGVPLVAAGNLALLTEDRAGPKRTFALALDPGRSSLQRSPDWPILLSNLVEERRRELPGPLATNVVLGEEITFRATPDPADLTPYTFRGPGAERELLPRATLVLEGVDRPGFFDLARGTSVVATLGASFQDAAESDLRRLGSGTRATQSAAATALPLASWLEIALAAVAFACILLDWLVLSRSGRFSSPERAPAAAR